MHHGKNQQSISPACFDLRSNSGRGRKRNKKTIISATAIFALVSSLFLPAIAKAYTFSVGPFSTSIDVNQIIQEADLTSVSSVSDKATQSLEDRYGFNENLWKSAKRKVIAPRVEIFFDNTNPRVGEKVTAHAVPEFFKNDPQNLYYTWYLIHTKDGTIQSATNSIRDGKIEAARIMARGDYDPDLDGQNYENSSEDPDKDGWPAVDANSYDEDKTAAPMGGADGVGGLPEETVEAYSSATEWCDSLGGHSWNDCSLYDEASYRPLNTYYSPKSDQTNHYCGLCENYFSGDGASSYTNAKTARNNCCYTNTPESSLQCSSTDTDTGETTYHKCPQVEGTDYCGVTGSSLFDSCYDAFKESNKSTLSTCLDNGYSSCKTDWANVHEDTNGDGFSDISEEDTTQVSRCYGHNFGTSYNASIFRENELSNSTTSDKSGLDFSVSCKHKWVNATNYKSGSGKFPTGEEKYWKTDPSDPDTDGDGFSDEADVIGLNQQGFAWTYQAGDRVGVVVEGTSMIPTDEKNAYYKIMWGYLDVCDGTKAGLMANDECDVSGDYGFGYLATKSPLEKGEEKVKASLSFSPDNPVADPSDDNKDNIKDDGTILDADQATIISSIDNTDYNPNNLYYTWQISKGSLEKDDWKEITNLDDNFNINTPASGIGLVQFSFIPKKDALSGDGDIIYFKVTLTVSQASGINSGKGRSSVVIPYNKNGIKISLYKVDVANGKAAIGDEVCNEGLYASLCPAVKGQMLAAKVSGGKYKAGNAEFTWKMNGNPLYPPADGSSIFDGWNSNAAFFPITKQEQEIEEISVTATPKDKLQPVAGSRLITVVHPAVFIKSSDTSAAWPGTYTTQNPNQKQAYLAVESSNMFNALTSSNAAFYLDFVPYYLLGNDPNTQIDWQINGTSVSDLDFYENNPGLGTVQLTNNDQAITIPTSENEGVYYDVTAEIKKYWSDEERGIAYTAWGVAPQSLDGKNSVTVATTASAPFSGKETVSANPKQILAAVGNNLPHYFMYLLRLALAMAVMFFASFILYGFIQSLSARYEKK